MGEHDWNRDRKFKQNQEELSIFLERGHMNFLLQITNKLYSKIWLNFKGLNHFENKFSKFQIQIKENPLL